MYYVIVRGESKVVIYVFNKEKKNESKTFQ